MLAFFAELKRRHIYRVAAAYAVLAWLLLQLVNNVAPVLDLPPWVARAFLLLLVISFPVALFFAWMRELAPADAATTHAATGKLDWVLIGALVVVIALVSYQQLVPPPGGTTARQQQPGVTPAALSSAQPTGISIAVLPFANLSGDTSQEFFSDGMTEEITSALAKVPSVRMVGRSSAFQFKGQNRDLRAIGQALGAAYLIDGSVRKAGDQVRITAQLVQADNGVSVWTNSYDRELKNIFDTQSDIAEAIAGALRVPLGLKQGESLVSSRTDDVKSYQQYLRAKTLYRGRSIAEAAALLEPAVARDPGFAPAWALLARIHVLEPLFAAGARNSNDGARRRLAQMALSKAERAAREAIRLDPRHPDGYAALAGVQRSRGNWAESEDLYKQALALEPNEPDNLSGYGGMLANVGRLKDAVRVRQQLRDLEPFVPIYNIFTGLIVQAAGQRRAGIALLETVPPDPVLSYARNMSLSQAYAADGQYAKAADTLLIAAEDKMADRRLTEDAVRLLRQAPTKVNAPQTLPTFESDLNFVYAYVGALDRVMEDPERQFENGFIGLSAIQLWLPEYAPLRKTARFKAYTRKVGLVDYWRARGWPDLCRPVGADDFACE